MTHLPNQDSLPKSQFGFVVSACDIENKTVTKIWNTGFYFENFSPITWHSGSDQNCSTGSYFQFGFANKTFASIWNVWEHWPTTINGMFVIKRCSNYHTSEMTLILDRQLRRIFKREGLQVRTTHETYTLRIFTKIQPKPIECSLSIMSICATGRWSSTA